MDIQTNNLSEIKRKSIKTMFLSLLVSAILIGIDHITKYWAYAYLSEHGPIPIIKGVFSFTYSQNDGAAWGMFGGSDIHKWLPIIMAVVIAVIYQRIPANKRMLPLNIVLVFIFSGAVGNRIDRSVYGYVQDFIYFELIDFPIFNIADCYIVVATIVMGILIIFYYKDDSEFDGIFSFKKNKSNNMKK